MFYDDLLIGNKYFSNTQIKFECSTCNIVNLSLEPLQILYPNFDLRLSLISVNLQHETQC